MKGIIILILIPFIMQVQSKRIIIRQNDESMGITIHSAWTYEGSYKAGLDSTMGVKALAPSCNKCRRMACIWINCTWLCKKHYKKTKTWINVTRSK